MLKTNSDFIEEFRNQFATTYYKRVGKFYFGVGYKPYNSEKINLINFPTAFDSLGGKDNGILINKLLLTEGDVIFDGTKNRIVVGNEKYSSSYKDGKSDSSMITFLLAGIKALAGRVEVLSYTHKIQGNIYKGLNYDIA